VQRGQRLKLFVTKLDELLGIEFLWDGNFNAGIKTIMK
jgi:hypothetical protein